MGHLYFTHKDQAWIHIRKKILSRCDMFYSFPFVWRKPLTTCFAYGFNAWSKMGNCNRQEKKKGNKSQRWWNLLFRHWVCIPSFCTLLYFVFCSIVVMFSWFKEAIRYRVTSSTSNLKFWVTDMCTFVAYCPHGSYWAREMKRVFKEYHLKLK